jgi:8-oxo-dGTP diphosphatase
MESNEVESDPNFSGFGISVNCVHFKFDNGILKTLIVRRAEKLFQGEWALIGDLTLPNQDIEETAFSLTTSMFHSDIRYFKQFQIFSDMHRHPMGRVATVGYIAVLPSGNNNIRSHHLYSSAKWIPIDEVPNLCFDHNHILEKAKSHLDLLAQNNYFLLHFLPEKFTIYDLYLIYVYFNAEKLDRSNFRRKLLNLDFLIPLPEMKNQMAHRPAQLFMLNYEKINHWKNNGYKLDI